MMTVLRKLLALLNRRERVEFWLVLAMLIVVATVEVAGVASILPFMAVVANPDVIQTNHWLRAAYEWGGFASEQSFLVALGVLTLSLLVFGNLTKAASTWLTLWYHNKLSHQLARRLLARYMGRPYSFFLSRNTADLGKNILSEVSTVIGTVLSPATEVVSAGLICLAIMTLLVVVDPVVALAIAIVLGGAYGGVYLTVRGKLAAVGAIRVDANRQKFRSANEALSGIKDLKILGRETTFLKRFALFAERHANTNVISGVIGQIPRFALEIIAFGGILLMVLYLISQGQQTVQIVPMLALYAFAGYRLMPALQQLFAAATRVRGGVPALDLVYQDLMQNLADEGDPETQLSNSITAKPLPFRKCIELRNVSFRYEGAATDSLCGLNLTILPHTSVGLVGPTGCGKTTTVDLILGLLSPTAGEILVDGIRIEPSNQANWQKNLGYVPQHIYISDDTITRNIAFGVPDDEIDMTSVRRAARIANLADFVEQELPDGYDTGIGERGVRLSGGQRQRIGIARAMYRDPAILVMDEATSALDGITEESVMDAVRNLSRKKTIILIAHRLTTVRDCDVIYQLDHGKIVAHGNYDNLMRGSSWFRSAAGG